MKLHPIHRRAILLFVALLAPFVLQAAEPFVTKTVLLDNFESYTNDQQLAKAWYKPPHGGGTRQTIEGTHKSEGRQAMKWEYSTTSDEKTRYSAICRVSKWDASGCNAMRFWLQPDGSGRKFTVQLNIASRAGRNIHDLWQTDYFPAKGETNGRVITIPFASLEHNVKYADSPDTSPVFKPEALIEIAFYIGLRGMPGDGAAYLDDLKAVHLEGLNAVKPGPRASLTVTNGLVAAWNFDEPSGLEAKDVSGSGLHGLLRGGAVIGAGRTGGAVECRQDALVEVPHASALDEFRDGLTVAAWVKRDADATWNMIISREITDGPSEYFGLAVVKNKALFSVDADGAHYKNIKSVDDMPVGEWIHLVGTYDNAAFKLYVNGKLAKSEPYAIPFKYQDENPIIIGGNTNSKGKTWVDCFHGKIDEVRLYNRALVEKELIDLYSAIPSQP